MLQNLLTNNLENWGRNTSKIYVFQKIEEETPLKLMYSAKLKKNLGNWGKNTSEIEKTMETIEALLR